MIDHSSTSNIMYSEVLLFKAQSKRTATAIPNKLPLPSANPLCPTEINFVINLFLLLSLHLSNHIPTVNNYIL